jgi:hypothetical protein
MRIQTAYVSAFEKKEASCCVSRQRKPGVPYRENGWICPNETDSARAEAAEQIQPGEACLVVDLRPRKTSNSPSTAIDFAGWSRPKFGTRRGKDEEIARIETLIT